MDWIFVSSFIGVLLPPIIELYAKKVAGQGKIAIVFSTCLIMAVVQTGIDGGWVGWNWAQFGGSTIVILVLATNMWGQMWKKWYPETSDPIEGHKQEIIKIGLND